MLDGLPVAIQVGSFFSKIWLEVRPSMKTTDESRGSSKSSSTKLLSEMAGRDRISKNDLYYLTLPSSRILQDPFVSCAAMTLVVEPPGNAAAIVHQNPVTGRILPFEHCCRRIRSSTRCSSIFGSIPGAMSLMMERA